MPRLEIQFADGRTASVPLAKDDLYIGRDAACDVPLEDSITSRRHARLYRDGGGHWWIQDLRSKNGTYVNQQTVQTSRVRAGDRLGIGGCTLRLVDERAPAIVLRDDDTTTWATTTSYRPDQRLSLAQQRLEKLYELNERLTGKFDRDELLGELLDICAAALRLERAGVAVWSGEPHPPQWVRVRRYVPEGTLAVGTDDIHISRSLVERALYKGDRILINDTANMTIDPTASMVSNHICSAMCVPMVYLNQVRGVMYGDRVSSTGGYTKEDLDFFAALGKLGAMGLANVQLVEELRRRQEVETQLNLARQIQSHLFPGAPLLLPGSPASPAVEIHALNDPGQRISGDYYDYFVRPDGRIVLVIADVVGKGIPASLLMANMQAAVHVTLLRETDLAAATRELNDLICRNVSESRFITAWLGLLDAGARRLICVNAGHLPAFFLRRGGHVEALELEPGLPLGIESGFAYAERELALPPDTVTLFVYTDGVVEAEDEGGNRFGDQRLIAALQGNCDQPPDELIERVRRLIRQFTRNQAQSDDITMMAVRVEAAGTDNQTPVRGSATPLNGQNPG